MTEMGLPVDLPLPLEPPEPAEGCEVCASHDVWRTRALRAGDYSRATDHSVRIRRHDTGHGG